MDTPAGRRPSSAPGPRHLHRRPFRRAIPAARFQPTAPVTVAPAQVASSAGPALQWSGRGPVEPQHKRMVALAAVVVAFGVVLSSIGALVFAG
ncbi:hypothetical protein [Arthrobacter woluwensis]|uniref:hypothetical protein n=1 Tax=Arthrobacter woluwensis TaxID=156980 RepID=UPI001AAE6103|nr:hypothetical protein [Arthrobacter woluwensis]QTF71878.1 hypothetical protein G8758_07575 [Arthrobacter woluwensis]